MKIKIKKLHENAVIPSYSKQGDAGMDLTITEVNKIDLDHMQYKFGIAVEIPEGYVGLIFPRSSIYKQRQVFSNSVGVVDSGYRGEIMAVMIGTSDTSYVKGERAAQLLILPYPQIEFEETEELSVTERGNSGYGSSGK